jgi:transposase
MHVTGEEIVRNTAPWSRTARSAATPRIVRFAAAPGRAPFAAGAFAAIEVVIAPEDTACPCCQGPMDVIGEETSERQLTCS